jgi:hypothetical protein
LGLESDLESFKIKPARYWNMKTFILILTLTATALHTFAQGTIVYYNRVAGSVVAPVYGADIEPGPVKYGNTSAGFPAGTQVYTGAALAGTGYSVTLWAGPEGSTVEQLALVPGSLDTFRTGGFAGAIDNSGGVIAIPGVPEGNRAVLQLRVWDNLGGTITSWPGFSGPGLRALSRPFTSQPLGGNAPPPNMAGLESFNYAVPEPGIYALAGLGATALWLFRRRK